MPHESRPSRVERAMAHVFLHHGAAQRAQGVGGRLLDGRRGERAEVTVVGGRARSRPILTAEAPEGTAGIPTPVQRDFPP